MNIREIFSARAIAINRTTVASNKIKYLGSGFFTPKKKQGLDLKWIKTSKGLPVSLAPSNFDAKSTIRSREGFTIDNTEMAFFRESMLVKEQDEIDIARVQEASDPYATDVLNHIYDDANTLIDAANVVPERMIMQLLTPADGSPKISIQANGVTYAYNYDPNATYVANNYLALSTSTDKWSDTVNSDPLDDVRTGQDSVESKTGTRPDIMIVSRQTMSYLVANAKVRSALLAQNTTATLFVTDELVKNLFKTLLGVSIVVYSKQYKNEAGTTTKFFADGFATLVPSGAPLGNTWYGTTPEERTLMGSGEADVSIVDTGVAVTVTTTTDPVNTKTTVSEIVLPSFERMDETFVIKCY
jgi:hypothetical protein